jgi:hypothetical protein
VAPAPDVGQAPEPQNLPKSFSPVTGRGYDGKSEGIRAGLIAGGVTTGVLVVVVAVALLFLRRCKWNAGRSPLLSEKATVRFCSHSCFQILTESRFTVTCVFGA